MKEALIKEILSENVKDVDVADFNANIIRKLNIKKYQKNSTLFKENEVIAVFALVFLFVLGANLGISSKLSKTTMLVGSILCTSPMLLMIYNKIYQLTNQQN